MSEFILVNMIKTPDGTLLRSRHRHDFVEYKDKNGFNYFVDGGIDYLRRGKDVDAPDYVEMSLYASDDHTLIREYFEWRTYGKDGKQPLSLVRLKDMETDHIKSILEYLSYKLPDHIITMFEKELSFRE